MAIVVPLSGTLRNHDKTFMTLRVTFTYEADLAGGVSGQYASEFEPSMHMFLTHGLGVLHVDAADDGVVVITPAMLAKQKPLVVEIPFNPAAAQYVTLSQDKLWALPGARSTKKYQLPDASHRWIVPADASISFNAQVQTATQHGQSCRTKAGEALFLLSELLDRADAKENDVRAEWQVNGDEPLVKGFVAIQTVKLVRRTPTTGAKPGGITHITSQLDPTTIISFAPLEAAPTVFHGDDRDPSKAKQAAGTIEWLYKQIDKSLDIFYPSSAPLGTSEPTYLRRMHCPYFNTNAGMLYGSAYALRVPRTLPPPHYFQAALTAALFRGDVQADHLLASIELQRSSPDRMIPSTRAVMQTFAAMLCVYANSMVYLDDFTNEGGRTYLVRAEGTPDAAKKSHVGRVRLLHRNDVANETGAHKDTPVRKNVIDVSEDYKIARLGHGDDCEGVAKEIYLQYWQFGRADLTRDSGTAETTLLRYFQELSRGNVFTPMLVLAGVTNKKLDVNVRRDMTDQEAMAHTYTALVPTERVLSRLVDGNATDVRFAGLSKLVKTSTYAKTYNTSGRKLWHSGMNVLICEGTARSSPLVLPITSYYDTVPQKQRAAQRSIANFNAQVRFMQDLPMNVVQLEVPNRHIDDTNNDIAEDRIDASDFYKGNSAAYVSAFRDTGILDFAFAWHDQSSGRLTHGIHFNRFVTPGQWHPSVALVPYNRINATQGGIVDAVLAQLEPIPALRRNPPTNLTSTFTDIESLFEQNTVHVASSEALLTNGNDMPPPPGTIVISIRDEDATNEVTRQITTAIVKHRLLFTQARVLQHYLSDAPVHGDEDSLPPVIVHDISLSIRGEAI